MEDQVGLMERIWQAIGRQLRHPAGWAGIMAGWLMSVLNERPSRAAIAALNVLSGERILELGFGSGCSLATLSARYPDARLSGIDASGAMLAMARRKNRGALLAGRISLVQGQFSPLPFPEGSFDKILLVNVVYFFDVDGNDIADAYRVLRPGGRLVAYATERSTMRRWPFAGAETHRTFDADALRALFEQGGFEPSHIRVERLELPFGIAGLLTIIDKGCDL